MHFLGIAGMPRRISDYPLDFILLNKISSFGSIFTTVGIALFFFILFLAFANISTNDIISEFLEIQTNFLRKRDEVKSKFAASRLWEWLYGERPNKTTVPFRQPYTAEFVRMGFWTDWLWSQFVSVPITDADVAARAAAEAAKAASWLWWTLPKIEAVVSCAIRLR